jgi:polar amino acid transport system permease protein
MEMLTCAAGIYWGMSVLFEVVQHRLEVHFGRGTVDSHR